MSNQFFRNSVDLMVKNKVLKSFDDEAFKVPIDENRWYQDVSIKDIIYMEKSGIHELLEESEDMETVYSIFRDITYFCKEQVFSEKLVQKVLKYCLLDIRKRITTIFNTGLRYGLDKITMEHLYPKIIEHLFYQENSGEFYWSFFERLGDINLEFDGYYEDRIIKDCIVERIIQFLTDMLETKNEYAKFRAYIKGISALCDSPKLLKKFAECNITNLLPKIYSNLDKKEIHTLWGIHNILLNLKKAKLCDEIGTTLAKQILDREREHFVDRANFPKIIENLKKVFA